MIIIDDIIVSDEFRDARFCCHLQKCLGACCVEGDAGAPLEEEEVSTLEDELDMIKPYMRQEGIDVVDKLGVFDYDAHGDFVTPLIKDKDCAFVYYENNKAKCAIEKAWEEGKIDFQKPVSCHLYPVRITKSKNFEAVNYHKWYICEPARTYGKKEGVLLYRFLKDSLIRKYGIEWYEKLVKEIERKEPMV
ncbi:MAG: DUF3109 family protein [Bacteroidales bacterium]|nr:DUF3109 family protein [Bacteroidales bacterium]MCF8402876.1 DUF3109 family protein [Bacteroidales bacterium]